MVSTVCASNSRNSPWIAASLASSRLRWPRHDQSWRLRAAREAEALALAEERLAPPLLTSFSSISGACERRSASRSVSNDWPPNGSICARRCPDAAPILRMMVMALRSVLSPISRIEPVDHDRPRGWLGQPEREDESACRRPADDAAFGRARPPLRSRRVRGGGRGGTEGDGDKLDRAHRRPCRVTVRLRVCAPRRTRYCIIRSRHAKLVRMVTNESETMARKYGMMRAWP